jgi:hypothetical protein
LKDKLPCVLLRAPRSELPLHLLLSSDHPIDDALLHRGGQIRCSLIDEGILPDPVKELPDRPVMSLHFRQSDSCIGSSSGPHEASGGLQLRERDIWHVHCTTIDHLLQEITPVVHALRHMNRPHPHPQTRRPKRGIPHQG